MLVSPVPFVHSVMDTAGRKRGAVRALGGVVAVVPLPFSGRGQPRYQLSPPPSLFMRNSAGGNAATPLEVKQGECNFDYF